MKTEWTITGLNQALGEDLKQCHTQSERINCEAIYASQMRSLAATKRALTPGEIAVLEKYSIL